jgi:hypothetical protein
MKLSEHFKQAVSESSIDVELDRYNKMLDKIKDFESIFVNGIKFPFLRVNEDDSISYDGEIEFSKTSYVDSSKKMPFKFKIVKGSFSLLNGYPDKLDSLEGLPEKCRDLNINCSMPKPPSFFEGHFPKELYSLDLSVTSLQNCKFGIETVEKKIELSVEDISGLKSFEGLPDNLLRLTCNFPPNWVRSFKGLPKNIGALQFFANNGNIGTDSNTSKFTLGDLAEHAGSIESISTNQYEIAEGTPMLSLFKIKGLQRLTNHNIIVDTCKEVFNIMQKHLPAGDAFDCQEALVDAGYGQYAKSK